MRRLQIVAAALAAVATLSVTAAQSAVDPSPIQGGPIKGWTAVAGLSGPAVVKLARTLPIVSEAEGDQPWCDHAGAVQAALRAEFEESLVTRLADGTQLWGSDMTGTWTVVLDRNDQTQCVVASGIGYRDGTDPRSFLTTVGLG